jgi:hypothetical protein
MAQSPRDAATVGSFFRRLSTSTGPSDRLIFRLTTSRKCEHNRRKNRCKECGGSQICEHDCIRSECKECLVSSICPYKRRKDQCKECRGSQICEHNRRRSEFKECLGSSICPHKRRKSRCQECGGSQMTASAAGASSVWGQASAPKVQETGGDGGGPGSPAHH